ncbi:MAG: hypothetical protein WB562_16550 [Candidatus Sulfotelmatobacter sp.]
MSFRVISEGVLRKLFFLSIVIAALPALAWSQHNKPSSAPKPSAPAQHASAPKPSAPSHSNASGGQHGSAPGGQHNSAAGGQHGSNMGGQHGSSANSQHGSAANGQHGSAANAQHGSAANSQHGSTANAQHGAAGGQHGSAANGQHGSTANAQHGAAGSQHGSAAAGQHGAAQKGTGAKGSANSMNAKGAGGKNAGGANARGSHTAPGKQVSLKGGGSAHIRPNGQIRSVNRNGMHIQHGMHGGRTVVSNRNGVRVVSNGRRGGYTQRAYVTRGGRSYYSRTYYYNGGYRSGVYVGYNYGGYPYYGYYPAAYYGPAYYGWAYNPWPAPVAYGWGWGGAPWYGYYGAYYEPYPVYPSAAFWLTDYLVAASLQAAYAAQAESNEGILRLDAGDGWLVASLLAVVPPAGSEGTKLSPDVKKALAEEVKVVLATEQAEAKTKGSSGGGAPASKNEAPPALDPKFKTFVVSSDLSLVADGDECALADGDVIERTTDTPDDDRNISVKVVASKKSDCAIGKEGPVAMDDLQEMYNHFRESLKDGMGELAKKQGTGGLPKSPDTTTTAGDVPAPEPDKNAEKTLKEQQAAADQTESEVKQEAGSGGGQ